MPDISQCSSRITRKGLAFVVCAPSGAGKTTLTGRLRSEFSSLTYSVSCTTRAPRPGETDGKDYHFISVDEFLKRRDANGFAEYAKVHGNYYGTPLQGLREQLATGCDVLFDIDVQGASQLRLSLDCVHFVFLFPPSLQTLSDRLINRGVDDQQTIERRLLTARDEIRQAHWFDSWIVNDDLETAYASLRASYMSASLQPRLWPNFSLSLLEG